MSKPIIVAVVGLAGSGKTDASSRFVERGFVPHKYSSAIYEELDLRGLYHNETNERAVREELRREFGMGVAALRIMPRVEEAVLRGENVVVESLYSWAEYKLTKEKFGDQFKTLAVYASPEVRYARLEVRPVRPLDKEAAKSRDYAEIEISDKGGPIAIADWTILNLGTKGEFLQAVDDLVTKILAN